ncbi:MAG TPA: hypothetical protein VJ456_06430 [Acidimicrobiia bacterium]|nr:hypothetical protein [Acidimicrobiia bacterium]
MGQIKRQLVIWGAIAATTAVLPGLALADKASPDFGGRHGRGHEQRNAKLRVAGRAISRAEKAKDAYGMEIRGSSGDKPTDAGGMVRFAHRGDKGSEGLVGQITCLSKDQAGVVTATGTIKRGGTRAAKGDKGKGLKPGAETAAATSDDGTALLDELAPWDDTDTADLAAADDASADNVDLVAADPAPPSLPGAPSAPNMPAPPNQDPNKKHDHGKGGGELAGKDFAFTIDVPGKPQHFSQPKIGDKGTLAACSGGGAPVEVTRGGFRTRDTSARNDGKGDGGDRRGDHRHGWWRR